MSNTLRKLPHWMADTTPLKVATVGQLWIYVMRRADTREIKIGQSVDPRRRLRSIQSHHARPLELLLTWRGTHADERTLHRRFTLDRLGGEWFRESAHLLAWVERQREYVNREAKSA